VLKNYIKYILCLIVTLTIFSCSGEKGSSIFKPKRVSPPSIEDRVALSQAENLGRASWQQPTFIVGKLGELEGKTVADIGSGTGYFTFQLAHKKAKVIAIDIDKEMLAFIDTYKSNISPDIETRLAEPNNPMLGIEEVDKVLIVNTIGYIKNLSAYLKTLRPGITKGGLLVISDYKAPAANVPTPSVEKIVSIEKLEKDLLDAGYINISLDDTTLQYQYVVTAEVPE
jgi:2-polyprenyl-3-methyl-5-hydroxy-6-metoxy-1,4-benzoquinol methylase